MTRIAILTISDHASRGDYQNLGGLAVESVRDALLELYGKDRAYLVLTTGGTGPSPHDLTPSFPPPSIAST